MRIFRRHKVKKEAGAWQIYTVVQGDSLWKIASRHFGDGTKWNRIYEANRDQIDDPDILYPGQVLTIPKI